MLCLLSGLTLVPAAHARAVGERAHHAAFHGQGDARLRQMQRVQREGRYPQRGEAAVARPGPIVMPAPALPADGPKLVAPAPADNGSTDSRPGRLTPDERRALRQQINEAGRDLYRPARP